MSAIRFEGLTLTVASVENSLAFYGGRLGLKVEVNAAPDFGMIRIDGHGTIGLLSAEIARREGIPETTAMHKRAIHVEFSTDDLDGLYETLKAKGIEFAQPPHDEPWERSMTAYDPDGYAVEFAQGRRGETAERLSICRSVSNASTIRRRPPMAVASWSTGCGRAGFPRRPPNSTTG